jgi:hypothetical protein
MGIKDDHIELKGSDYERKLYDLKKGHVTKFLVHVAPGKWEFHAHRPDPGQGAFIERTVDGTCCRWNNADDRDTSFHLV